MPAHCWHEYKVFRQPEIKDCYRSALQASFYSRKSEHAIQGDNENRARIVHQGVGNAVMLFQFCNYIISKVSGSLKP
ncbi:hypothetical protein ACKLNO_05000 [Neisseriaceae bacterium B1]